MNQLIELIVQFCFTIYNVRFEIFEKSEVMFISFCYNSIICNYLRRKPCGFDSCHRKECSKLFPFVFEQMFEFLSQKQISSWRDEKQDFKSLPDFNLYPTDIVDYNQRERGVLAISQRPTAVRTDLDYYK